AVGAELPAGRVARVVRRDEQPAAADLVDVGQPRDRLVVDADDELTGGTAAVQSCSLVASSWAGR
ncbi:hypothetical protein, partial [Streptomyces mirabilis]|uniref:hypothetical protein n=1 Tax=Streptomyces mirabilis TaxID=68239 RepID=UPI00367FC622